MPEHACRDRPPGTPRTRDAADALGARERAHALDLAHRCHEREVARRPDVSSPERHQEIDVRGPRADASELDQCGPRTLVVKIREVVGVELASDDRPRKAPDVGALLTREPGATQVGLGQGSDPLGRHRAGKSLQPSVRGAARRQGNLLLEDDLHKGLEPWRAVPQRRRPVPRDDRGKVRVSPRELGDALGQPLVRQLQRHADLTKHLRAL